MLQAINIRFLSQEALCVCADMRIKRILAIMPDVALQKDSPGLIVFRREAQRSKWDFNPPDPALVRHLGGGVPHHVVGNVRLVITVNPDAILLNAVRVDEEEQTLLAVVEGIEDNTDLIVVVDQLAPHHVAAKLRGMRLEAHTYDIQILVGISEVEFGLFRDRAAIMRVPLLKLLDLQHFSGERRREFHLQKIGEHGSLVEVWNVQVGELKIVRRNGDRIFRVLLSIFRECRR